MRSNKYLLSDPAAFRAYFLARSRVQETGCFQWLGTPSRSLKHKNNLAYASVKIDQKSLKLHRAAYQALIGPVPAGMMVCHQCDNPLCWNPEHLWIGNAGDNLRDSIQKGRFDPSAIGKRNRGVPRKRRNLIPQ